MVKKRGEYQEGHANALSKTDQFGKKHLARIAKNFLEKEKNHGA